MFRKINLFPEGNIIFEKTSFLQGGNSTFIKELYFQYLQDPTTIPQSWREFFDGLNEDQEIIKKEILGPRWSPKKNNTLKTSVVEKDLKAKLCLDHRWRKAIRTRNFNFPHYA